ncbi:toxin co-regulated pilus biosynthesis Q family protein [Hydrogenophaga sp. NFH-34]|uniref:toxin co-regulated pilus biosynthesis Q family protein n=1 Tax=Hydrogenophaga sp. NFH-34 TaxID=2744446 RepID=UPI001F1B3A93|nr:toxin co-regulated pilus biosynthesis Q family protein [Hydrogenophaga sp. NFH-34]
MLKLAAAMVLAAATFGAAAQPTISHIGQPQDAATVPSSLKVVSDLMGATKVILPGGWAAYARQGMDVRRASTAEFVAGETWTSALERWASDEGLSVRLDWKNKRAYLDQVSAPRVPLEIDTASKPAATTAPAVATLAMPAATPAPNVPAAPKAINLPAETWSIQISDVRLETTLERWAKQAGYTLIWDADRHVLITAEDNFSGSFDEALLRVLSSPAISKSDFPLEAVIYGNNPPVLRITGLGEQGAAKE